MGAEAWYKEEILAMLCWTVILGGVLIIMRQHSRSEALFYYFRLEDQVPETHLLRLIDKHISFAFVREKLKESYSDTGRPSIQTVRQYLVELEQQNPTEEPVHEQELVSTTDPDATYATKGGTPARLGYYDNYLVDNHSCVIVGVQPTAARMSQETVAAQAMITRFVQRQGGKPASLAADATYGNGEFLQWLLDRGITAYMRTRDSVLRKNNPGYGPERFTYLPESNSYRCPAGEQLNYVGLNVRNRARAYIGSAKRCGACSQKAQCTTGRYKYLAIPIHESARRR